MHVKDVFVITYGSSRWGWKFHNSIVQKIYPSLDEAIFYASQEAKKYDADVYIEQKNGKFKKLKSSQKPRK